MAVKNDSATLARAIRELGINVPIYSSRVVGNRLELHCYGGQVLSWPIHPPDSPIHCTSATLSGRPCKGLAILHSDPPRCHAHREA